MRIQPSSSEDGGREPQPKEYRRLLEIGEGKETDPP